MDTRTTTIFAVVITGILFIVYHYRRKLFRHPPETWTRVYDVNECPWDSKWVGRKISDIVVPNPASRKLVKAIKTRRGANTERTSGAVGSENRVNRLVPYIIYQTNESDVIPVGMAEATQTILDWNPGYDYYYFTDTDAREYLVTNFPDRVVRAYDALIPGAYKADLFRYCVLWETGGIYIDMGMVVLCNLDDIIRVDDRFVSPEDNGTGGIYNAFMITEPKSPIMKEAINQCVANIEARDTTDSCLGITGPILLSRAYLAVVGGHGIPGVRLITYYRPDECMSGEIFAPSITTGVETRVISTRSPTYNSDRKWYNTKPHYSQLWKAGVAAIYKYQPSANLVAHQARLKTLLSTLDTLSKEHPGKIIYWISDGTLLGAERDKDIIGWDDDIDMFVPSITIKTLKGMAPYLRELGFSIGFRDHIWRFEYVDPTKNGYVDLFEVELDWENRWVYTDPANTKRWPNGWFYDDEVFPIVDRPLGNLVVAGPSIVEPYLERVYGADWKIPKKWPNHGTI